MAKFTEIFRKIVIKGLKLYQLILSGCCYNCCRFTPTCSRYAIEAIERWGLLKGGWYSAKRVVRCHPWCPGGEDKVPER